MLKALGYGAISRDGQVVEEFDTFTCAHGNEIVRVAPGMAAQAPFCRSCMKHICLKCQGLARVHGCVPTELMIMNMERRRR